MPIYTKTGDKGLTSLYGGIRVSKSDPRVEAYGVVDELTSFIGLTASKTKNKNHRALFINIQKDLYQIMAVLSGSKLDLNYLEEKIKGFEKEIDAMDKKLPLLRRFIIPGGAELSSWFHILRVQTRRAERRVVGQNPMVVKYLNRLSDLFFTLARIYGKDKEIVL